MFLPHAGVAPELLCARPRRLEGALWSLPTLYFNLGLVNGSHYRTTPSQIVIPYVFGSLLPLLILGEASVTQRDKSWQFHHAVTPRSWCTIVHAARCDTHVYRLRSCMSAYMPASPSTYASFRTVVGSRGVTRVRLRDGWGRRLHTIT